MPLSTEQDAAGPTVATLPGWPAAMAKSLTAAYVGMSERWIDSAVSAGEFPRPVKFGRSTRWRRTDVDVWLADRGSEQ